MAKVEIETVFVASYGTVHVDLDKESADFRAMWERLVAWQAENDPPVEGDDIQDLPPFPPEFDPLCEEMERRARKQWKRNTKGTV